MIAVRAHHVLVVACALALGACRSESKPSLRAVSTVDAHAAILRAKVPGIGFAAVTRDREVAVAGEGLADEATKTAANGDTVFEAASIAKIVVAAAVMQLVEQGTLDLDEDASKYVGFVLRHPSSPTPISLRMLLTHRASLRDRNDELAVIAEGHPLATFVHTYVRSAAGPRAEAFLEAPPGTTMTYSNVGAALAALAVERAEGASFADVTERRVFAPLRMKSTGWTSAPRGASFVATPFALRDGKRVALAQASHAVYPAVDLRSSARDLARFTRAILREGELDGVRILSAASVRTMLHEGADPDQALAWQLRTIGGRRVVGHEGEDAGASTALYIDLAAGTGAVVLTNGDAFSSGDATRAEALGTLIDQLLTSATERR